MPVYNFKKIAPVPTADAFIDIVLTRTQRRTPTVVHEGFKTGVHDGIYDGNVDSNCDSDKDGVATIADWPCGMWIGGNDREEEGTWRWANGHLMSHYDFGGFDPMTGNRSGVYPWGNVNAALTCSHGTPACASLTFSPAAAWAPAWAPASRAAAPSFLY